MMSIQTLEAQIMTTLNSVSGVAAFDHEPKAFDSLPAITLNYQGFQQIRFAYGSYKMTYSWILRLYVAVGEDAKTATDQVKNLVSQYVAAFRNDPTLGGLAISSELLSGSLELDTNTANPRYIHSFALQVQTEEA